MAFQKKFDEQDIASRPSLKLEISICISSKSQSESKVSMDKSAVMGGE